MNRQIKFRGYSEELKSFVYGFYQEVDVESVGYSYIFWQGNTTPVRADSVAQFTGLIDKNGKEVYEGDIIKWKETRFHTQEQLEKDVPMPKFFISPVLFTEGSFVVHSSDILPENPEEYNTFLACFFNDCMDFKFDFKAEVIGNIYENPELL